MFRAVLFGIGAAVLCCVALYFATGQARYLRWARYFLLGSLAAGVGFSLVLLAQRLA